jgi:hypothetical protein
VDGGHGEEELQFGLLRVGGAGVVRRGHVHDPGDGVVGEGVVGVFF